MTQGRPSQRKSCGGGRGRGTSACRRRAPTSSSAASAGSAAPWSAVDGSSTNSPRQDALETVDRFFVSSLRSARSSASRPDHDNPNPQRIAVAALGREHLVLDGVAFAQRADDPAELALVLVVVADDLVANRAVQQQLEAKRVVDPLDEVPGLAGVLAGAAADRADLDVGVIRIGVPDFVMGGGGDAIEVAAACARPKGDAIEFLCRQRRMVVAHVERVRVLQRAVLGDFPGLQMLDRHLEVRPLGIGERTIRLADAEGRAHLVGHEPHRDRL